MSQAEKSHYYRQLQAVGVEFERNYREYTTAELKTAFDEAVSAGIIPPHPPPVEVPKQEKTSQPRPGIKLPPVAPKDANEMPGQRLNTREEDEPIRTDPETGYIWYQEEVPKSAFAKPRGRRVLKYNDPGVETKVIRDNEGMSESFEVAGNRTVPSEVKVTLPSYQVGQYRNPRLPFKIHCYNGNEGFDLFEVEEFYGGREQVPEEVKTVYVDKVLCYDIRLTVRAINLEHRQLQLAGRL